MCLLSFSFLTFVVLFLLEIDLSSSYSIVSITWNKKDCPVKEMRDFMSSHRTKLSKLDKRVMC